MVCEARLRENVDENGVYRPAITYRHRRNGGMRIKCVCMLIVV